MKTEYHISLEGVVSVLTEEVLAYNDVFRVYGPGTYYYEWMAVKSGSWQVTWGCITWGDKEAMPGSMHITSDNLKYIKSHELPLEIQALMLLYDK